MIPTPDSIQRAGEILREIEALQNELVTLFSGATSTAPKRRGRPPGLRAVAAPSAAPEKGRRKMSAEGRARIAAAAKARWAKFHASKKKAEKA